jgi:hypothetical protein
MSAPITSFSKLSQALISGFKAHTRFLEPFRFNNPDAQLLLPGD